MSAWAGAEEGSKLDFAREEKRRTYERDSASRPKRERRQTRKREKGRWKRRNVSKLARA